VFSRSVPLRREGRSGKDIGLHSAKESGDIENDDVVLRIEGSELSPE
jgi:hypothetical protein